MSKERKIRADQLLVQQGLAASREQGKRLIMAGQAQVVHSSGQGQPIAKPGTLLAEETLLRIEAPERFVSRGGEKLLTALDHFQLQVQDLVAVDIGASTGGFTDCLLQFGAKQVYAVDVGYGQLHWRLRNDPRVVVLERVNVRLADPGLIPVQADLEVIDCSFISLTKILPACMAWIRPGGLICALIKPQFELPRGSTAKGVVRCPQLREQAVSRVVDFAAGLGLECQGSVASKVLGPKGNQEFLVLFRFGG